MEEAAGPAGKGSANSWDHIRLSWSEARNALSRRRLRRWASHEASDLARGRPWGTWMVLVRPTGKSATASARDCAVRNPKKAAKCLARRNEFLQPIQRDLARPNWTSGNLRPASAASLPRFESFASFHLCNLYRSKYFPAPFVRNLANSRWRISVGVAMAIATIFATSTMIAKM